jgi:tetratricopeptide (TPR) repeat protein
MGEARKVPPLPKPVPPANGRIGGREGEIVNELSTTLGVVLWQDARDVRLWLEVPPDERAALFPRTVAWVRTKRLAAKAQSPELADALDEIAVLREAPAEVSGARIAAAAEAVAVWAFSRELLQTAITYAELAAQLAPDTPHLANLAGRVTREAHEYDRAEAWFRRGIGAARAAGDKVELARGHLGYARLCKETDRAGDAAKHLRSGARLARRYGPLSLAAEAEHDAFALLLSRLPGQPAARLHAGVKEAQARARQALQWYGKTHKRLPFFAIDVAQLCIFVGNYVGAARLLKFAMRLIEAPAAQAAISAMFAGALTGAGYAHEAETYRRRAVKRLERDPTYEALTRWHLADAERLARHWEPAREEALRALAVATATRDAEVEFHIRNELRLIDHRDAGPVLGKLTVDTPEEVLNDLRTRLAAWSPRKVRRRHSGWENDWAA